MPYNGMQGMMAQHMGLGWYGYGWLFQLLILALFLLIVWWLVRGNRAGGSAEDILKRRLANGEITQAAYRKLRREIGRWMELDAKRLVIGLSLVFLLGMLFAFVNGEYASANAQGLPLVVYAIAFVSVLVGATVVLLFQWRISRAQVGKLLRVLPREERLVVQTLFERRGELEQNKLVVLTGLSKVQVSRTVARLVERGVAEKKAMGNTNLVLLRL